MNDANAGGGVALLLSISVKLVITEVFADYAPPAGSAGGDTGKEWFEVFNASDGPLEMEGLTLTSSRTDGTQAATHRSVIADNLLGLFPQNSCYK